ncbi:Di-trans-poly-cis-decaprenylcistransferase [Exidia glandulosa HHB12029]|uniref:Alkyl transferase n=1 Tax=Exidia glandulosa HHB12029 TaxID=1314781 RepID=A0A165F3I4_EXIGL|nr:Di-trans-poly-cis-decaprenylcistransferase [Exidia glandulosa HHB12029]
MSPAPQSSTSSLPVHYARVVLAYILLKLKLFIIWVLKAGPMPQHVAFVMDGNRRYSRRKGVEVREGHSQGFVALRRVLEICFKLDIKCVTVYGFAIENFKRSEDEIANLMQIAKDGLNSFCEQDDLLQANGVRLNVIGHKSLLPVDVQEAIDRAESLTKHNSRSILNICFPYASRHEMTCAIGQSVQDAVDNASPNITEQDVDERLFTSQGLSPPLDVLIRSSGVKRFSDFLLWQCSENTQVHFTPTYWPEYGLRDFGPVILDFQRRMWSKRVHS